MKTRRGISRRHFVRAAASLPFGMFVRLPAVASSRQHPFSNAIALWHMDDLSNRSTIEALITMHGDAKLGVPLHGAEREASLKRGGDGKVAEFRGGYLGLGQGGAAIDLSGKKQMTLCLRVKSTEGKWDGSLLSLERPEEKHAGILYSAPVNHAYLSYETSQRIRQGQALEFLWRTDPLKDRVRPEYFDYELSKDYSRMNAGFLDGVLRLQAPIELMGPDQWHDFIIRFRNANLELFVDGVLVDEEWPHGALRDFRGPFLLGAGYHEGALQTGFHGQIDHLALWDRALLDEEISELSGGEAEVAKRDREFLGTDSSPVQYWRPRGFNTFVGDCMPAFYDGEFHFYYLFDRRHSGSKWSMGAHQFAHASSKDLIHWTHHPMAVKITEQWECSIGTGIIVPHQGTYHAFYIQHGRRCWFKDAPHAGDTIQVATSTDGLHFQKQPEPVVPWVYLRRQDGHPEDINPDIFPDVSDAGFYLSLSGEKLWTSGDLQQWEEAKGVDPARDIGKGICSSYFHWNGWYYIVSSGKYRMSREPLKPGWRWTEPEHPATLEGLGVPKAAAFTGNRYLMVGFLGGENYAGEAVFRELVQHEDGTLGTKWPAEMIPSTGAPLNLEFEPLDAGATCNGKAIRVTAPGGFSAGMLKGVPQDTRITLMVKPSEDAQAFGLCVRGKGAYAGGCELRFQPAQQRVQYGMPGNNTLAGEPEPSRYGTDFGVGGVSGLNRPFRLDIIVKNDFVDACIDNRRTIISRRPDRPQGDRIFLFVENGDVLFEDVTVRPLA